MFYVKSSVLGSSEMKFICLTLMLINGITGSRSDQFAVVGSADPVFAFAGEDVILPCSVKPNISVVDMRVKWFRSDLRDSQLVHLYEDHEDRNTEQILSYRGRTELNHQELPRGNAALRLSAVKVSDEGLYKCFIQSNSGADDATINFTVEAVGSPPVITVDGFDHSGGLHLQCESEGWYPEPDLEWLDSEGVRLIPETTETHRNTDRFSVKHTVTVHQREGKIHCRVKMKHHMLETLISSTSNMYSFWRTSVAVISVLSVIAGILIAIAVYKYRELSKLQREKSRMQNELSNLQHEKSKMQNELRSEKSKMQNELQHERSKMLNVHQRENSRIENEFKEILCETNSMRNVMRILGILMVNVTLDEDSAHPDLIVSGAGKQVKCGETKNRKDEGNNRFTEHLGVVGTDGFSSWCFYFEVQVKDQTRWDLGVARESAKRQGWTSLSPVNGYWTVSQIDGAYCARESSNVSLSLSERPQRVGVFVDYKKGLVSFNDADSMSLIYSYTDQDFNEKLYPFVCLGDYSNENSTPLIICDVTIDDSD